MSKNPHQPLSYFLKNFTVILGIVLIWRGVWEIIDYIDLVLFGGGHIPLAIGGIILGFLLLYLPDHDLKEIQKL